MVKPYGSFFIMGFQLISIHGILYSRRAIYLQCMVGLLIFGYRDNRWYFVPYLSVFMTVSNQTKLTTRSNTIDCHWSQWHWCLKWTNCWLSDFLKVKACQKSFSVFPQQYIIGPLKLFSNRVESRYKTGEGRRKWE